MKVLVLTAAALSLSSVAIAQRRPGQFWSLGGYGNVLFPGTGHSPIATPPPGGGMGRYFSQWPARLRRTTDPQPSAVVVPSPVYDEGYGADSSANVQLGDPGHEASPELSPGPPVIINQSLVSAQRPLQAGAVSPKDLAATCENAGGNAAKPQAAEEDRPTIYLIALKDHSIMQALGYWLETGTLHYVSAEYALNQVSIGLVDRALSQRLNDERGIPFKLPVAK
jgi:hypothetical protein